MRPNQIPLSQTLWWSLFWDHNAICISKLHETSQWCINLFSNTKTDTFQSIISWTEALENYSTIFSVNVFFFIVLGLKIMFVVLTGYWRWIFILKRELALDQRAVSPSTSPMPCGRHHPEKRAEHSRLKGDTACEANGSAVRKYASSLSRRKAIRRGVVSVHRRLGCLRISIFLSSATDSTSVLVSQTIHSSVSCTCICDFFHQAKHWIDTAKEQSSSTLLGGAVQSSKCWCPWVQPSAGIPWSWSEDIQSDSKTCKEIWFL